MEEPQTPPPLEIAPVWLRVGAALLDFLIFVVLTAMACIILGVGRQDGADIFIVGTFGFVIYYLGFTVMTATTPGKMAFPSYITDMKGRPLPPDAAILRFTAFFISLIFIAGCLVSLVLMLIDRRHRTLHDRVAHTLVLRGRADLTEDRWR
jgi:uncharacterized RDD family membrane protein YckC